VVTAFEQGWATLQNGELLHAAEQAGFDVLVTTDRNLWYQQNLTDRKIAIVVLSTTSWPRIQLGIEIVVRAVLAAQPCSYVEVEIPSALK
jgi:hypothetical protein